MNPKLTAAGAALLWLSFGSAHAASLAEQAAAKAAAADAEASAEGAADGDEAGEGDELKIYWEDGKTHIEMKHASVELSHRLQFLFGYQDPDAAVRLPGTRERGQGKGEFRIRRAKTTFEGWFWKPELTYEVQLSWAGPEEGASTQTPLEDLYVNWDASKDERFMIRFGQYKVPFGRQQMTTSSNLQFVDRSLLAGEFTPGRDLGVMLWGQLAERKLEYRAGVFNGNPAARNSNDNTKFQYVARLTFQPFGDAKYSEGDFESKDKALVAIGGQLLNNNLFGATAALGPIGPTDLNTTTLSGDLTLKYRGLSVFGEFFSRDREPQSGQSFNSDGFNVEVGYFLKRDVVQVAFRWAGWDPTDRLAGNDLSEIGGAINYFIRKHRLKLSADFRELEDEARDQKNRELRIQTYLTF